MELLVWMFGFKLFTAPLAGPAKVVDGDTLFVGETKVRLQGVDAWEWKQTCPDEKGRPWFCGKESTAFLKKLVEGESLLCQEVTKDRYQRIVATCFKDNGEDIGAALVRAGHGVAFTRYSDMYVGEEELARQEKTGGWRGLPDYPPIMPDKWRKMKKSGSLPE